MQLVEGDSEAWRVLLWIVTQTLLKLCAQAIKRWRAGSGIGPAEVAARLGYSSCSMTLTDRDRVIAASSRAAKSTLMFSLVERLW